MIILYFNNNNLYLELDGYAYNKGLNESISNSQTYPVNIKIDAYINDNNLSNDKIIINYNNIFIKGNIIFKNKTEKTLKGNIISFDNTNGNDEIIGKITLYNKGEKCLISLYNYNLEIIAPGK